MHLGIWKGDSNQVHLMSGLETEKWETDVMEVDIEDLWTIEKYSSPTLQPNPAHEVFTVMANYG